MSSKQETVADIVQEIRQAEAIWHRSEIAQLPTQYLKEWSDRIEAAAKRECEATSEKSSQVGNAAKMREALEEIVDMATCYFPDFTIPKDDDEFRGAIIDEAIDYTSLRDDFIKAVIIARAALAATPRNCDRPECATSKAAQDVWRKEDGGKTAYYEWLLATYTEG